MSAALPSTGMIVAFCAVYEAGSFAKAAERLHMTPPAISYQIRIFEELIGQPLFQRSPIGISSTAIAHDLYRDARSILQLSKGIMHRSALQSQEGPIRILATQAFASLWLMPRIPKLLSRFNDKRFEIVGWIGGAVDHESEDLSSTTDIEIRYATPDSLPLDKNSHLIAQDSAIPVCAPHYFEKIQPDFNPSLPEGVTIIHALNWPGTWDRWCQAAFGEAVKASDELHFQSTALCVQAALSGVGVAMAHAPLVADEIRAGHLLPAHSFRLTVKEGYFAIHSPKRRRRASFFDDFVDWCRVEMSGAQELT